MNIPQGSCIAKQNDVLEPVAEAIGLDLGDKESVWCRVGPDNRIISKGRVKTIQSALTQLFQKMPRTRVILENGTHARWVALLIESFDHEVIVANPRDLKWISNSTNKHDEADAEKLARMGRSDPQMLNPIQLRSQEQQLALNSVKGRRKLVEMRVGLAHQIRGIAKSMGTRLPAGHSSNWDGWVERMQTAMSGKGWAALERLLRVIAEVNTEIAGYDADIEALLQEMLPEARALMTVPFVGTLTAVTFVLTLADATRFRSSREVGAYLGLRPRRDASGGSDPQLRITKEGDTYLRCLLVQCAHHILMKNSVDSELRRWGLALCERGGKNARKRAVVAVARKLSVLLHRLWVTQKAYRPFCDSVPQLTTALGI